MSRDASQTQPEVEPDSHARRAASFFQDPQPYLSRSYNLRLRRETVLEMLGDWRPESILDVGCGDGSLSIPLLDDKVKRLVLVDITEAMLDRARAQLPERYADRATLILGELTQVELPEGEFDLVLCMGVLAHVKSPEAVIDRVAALVKPGGRVLLTISSGRHPLGMMRALYVGAKEVAARSKHRLKWLSTRRILAHCASKGLSVAHTFRYNFPAPLMDRLVPNDRIYGNIRECYGNSIHNSRSYLGSEWIVCLTKSAGGGVGG
ncbi:MAG: hypothetical protein NVSMB14_10600 [Isosphaeraceae bacterium]